MCLFHVCASVRVQMCVSVVSRTRQAKASGDLRRDQRVGERPRGGTRATSDIGSASERSAGEGLAPDNSVVPDGN